jgi:hypothetical protein
MKYNCHAPIIDIMPITDIMSPLLQSRILRLVPNQLALMRLIDAVRELPVIPEATASSFSCSTSSFSSSPSSLAGKELPLSVPMLPNALVQGASYLFILGYSQDAQDTYSSLLDSISAPFVHFVEKFGLPDLKSSRLVQNLAAMESISSHGETGETERDAGAAAFKVSMGVVAMKKQIRQEQSDDSDVMFKEAGSSSHLKQKKLWQRTAQQKDCELLRSPDWASYERTEAKPPAGTVKCLVAGKKFKQLSRTGYSFSSSSSSSSASSKASKSNFKWACCGSNMKAPYHHVYQVSKPSSEALQLLQELTKVSQQPFFCL